jgi:hypothetical protein
MIHLHPNELFFHFFLPPVVFNSSHLQLVIIFSWPFLQTKHFALPVQPSPVALVFALKNNLRQDTRYPSQIPVRRNRTLISLCDSARPSGKLRRKTSLRVRKTLGIPLVLLDGPFPPASNQTHLGKLVMTCRCLATQFPFITDCESSCSLERAWHMSAKILSRI